MRLSVDTYAAKRSDVACVRLLSETLAHVGPQRIDRNQFYVLQRVVIFGGCNIV